MWSVQSLQSTWVLDIQLLQNDCYAMLIEDLSGLTSELLRLKVGSAASSWCLRLKSGLAGAAEDISASLPGTATTAAGSS